MNISHKITVGVVSALLLACPAAKADNAPNIATGAYASSLPPIYPSEAQQQEGKIWGTTEVVRCPDGYGLSFERQSPDAAPAPVCRPVALNGGER